MRQLCLSTLVLILSALSLFPQGGETVVTDRPPPYGHVPPNVGPRNYGFVSPAQRMLLNYQQFGARVGKLLNSWEKWAFVHNDIIQSPVYDRESFVREEKLWRGVTKRMNQLVKSRLSRGYLLAAEDLKKERTAQPATILTPPRTTTVSPVPSPPPPLGPAAVNRNPTASPYDAIQPAAAAFTSHWIDWSQVHAQLMRADTYDSDVFQLEAELWQQVTSHMDQLQTMRPKNAFVEPGK